MKTCTCGGTEFYKNSGRVDGLDSICKSCRRKSSKNYQRVRRVSRMRRQKLYSRKPLHVR